MTTDHTNTTRSTYALSCTEPEALDALLGRERRGWALMGRRDGEGNKRRPTLPTLARGPLTVGPPRGRGPRPFPLPRPPPQCNTVWHTHPRQYSRHTVPHLRSHIVQPHTCLLPSRTVVRSYRSLLHPAAQLHRRTTVCYHASIPSLLVARCTSGHTLDSLSLACRLVAPWLVATTVSCTPPRSRTAALQCIATLLPNSCMLHAVHCHIA